MCCTGIRIAHLAAVHSATALLNASRNASLGSCSVSMWCRIPDGVRTRPRQGFCLAAMALFMNDSLSQPTGWRINVSCRQFKLADLVAACKMICLSPHVVLGY